MMPTGTSAAPDRFPPADLAGTTAGGEILLPLLARACAGDTRATEDLLTHLYVPLLRYVERELRMVHDAAVLAEDIVQDAVVRIAPRLEECRAESDGQLVAWALTVARTTGMNHFRRTRRQVADVAERASDQVIDYKAYRDWEREESSGDDGQHTRQGVLIRALQESLAALPAVTAELVRVRVEEQIPWAEVAQTFRTTATAAKRRFQRAQATLRREVLRRLGG